MEKNFTKEEKLKCLESRIIRCVDVNDSELLRELLEPLINGEEDVSVFSPIDSTALKNLIGKALIDAAVKNSPEVVETLLLLGAPVNYMDELKHTAILRAAEYGHIEVVKLLCRNGCDTNISDSWTRTPIHWAAHSRHTEVVRELLKHGALPDPVDKNYQFTPLMLAARMGKTEIVRMLLYRSREIIPDAKCILCSTPPDPAEFIISSLEDMKRQQENVDQETSPIDLNQAKMNEPKHNTAISCEKSVQPIIVQLLSDKGTQFKGKWDHLNRNQAQFYKYLETVHRCDWHKKYPRTALLERARDINHTDIHGETPIFDASRQGHWDIVEMLIDEGCDINHVAKFRGRQTAPILIARNSKNSVEMLVNLVRLNCDVELTGSSHFFGYWNLPPEHVTAFQLALMDGHILATKILALGGASLVTPTCKVLNWISDFDEKTDQEWVLNLLTNPRSLKELCRIRIRKCLCVKPYKVISTLPLPKAIQIFLTIPELEDFEKYFIKPSLS